MKNAKDLLENAQKRGMERTEANKKKVEEIVDKLTEQMYSKNRTGITISKKKFERMCGYLEWSVRLYLMDQLGFEVKEIECSEYIMGIIPHKYVAYAISVQKTDACAISAQRSE